MMQSISEFVLTWLQQNTNCDIDSVLEKQGYDGMPMSCSYAELPCF